MQRPTPRKILTWILPVLAIVGAIYFRREIGGLESAVDIPVWKIFFLNWLVPIIAFRFLWKRNYEPRTLLWLLTPSILFSLPVVFIYVVLLLFFSIANITRKIGIVVFVLTIPLLIVIAVFSPFLMMPDYRWDTTHINTGSRDVYHYSMGQGALGDDFEYLDSRQEILPGLVISNSLEVSEPNGRIDHIEVIDSRHIRYQVHGYSRETMSNTDVTKVAKLR